jgi:(1->4)-alpha-D-glucan 1-alpha-D-glucosylmutase
VVLRSTYRVQLSKEFGFDDAAAIAGYLAELGVSHLYCSPYLQAAPGSTHGYDVVDPGRLNDELGGGPAYAGMVGALRAAGLGQVLDIVPNHMATDAANRWWWDVLENGPASRYAAVFDIDWDGGDRSAAHTVLVPVLGDHYGRVLEAGELALARTGTEVTVRYHDMELPVSPRSLDELLAAAARRAGSEALGRIAEGYGALPTSRLTDEAAVTERHEQHLALRGQLEELLRADAPVARALDDEIDALNADPDRLDALLRRQNYRLAHWRTASEELDYRRFFNIESLIGVRVEDPEVFALTHRLIVELVKEGTVDGLRVDHVDGLRDPEKYLGDLAAATGGVYTVVEKILEPGESLRGSWPVAGTSGYDFLIWVNNLFVEGSNEPAMTATYEALSEETASYEEVVQASKQHVMASELAAEVERLVGILADLSDGYRRHRDHTRRELRATLREFIARFEVYRTYVEAGGPASDEDRRQVRAAEDAARAARPELDSELLCFLSELALGEHPGAGEAEFAQRLAQLTTPVMAKGVEDTAFYRYNRLISLNEVGGDPGVFGRPVAAFHQAMAASAEQWPEAMLTLSTHDTKRSADVRARINVISEMPDAWRTAAERWMGVTEPYRRDGLPDRNAIYLLFQTLLGAWPIGADRAVAFMAKATKEAKVHTSWTDPVVTYDEAMEGFVRGVLADDVFAGALVAWLAEHRVVERGRRNSLAQTVLLMTCPGSPDLYQGSELWDLSLVDPDNRRPVDYHERRRLLSQLGAGGTSGNGSDELGTSKLLVINRLLAHRQADPACYEPGGYEPLVAMGSRAGDVVGFRRDGLAVVVPCRGDDDWGDTFIELPPRGGRDVVTGDPVAGGERRLAELFAGLPVAVVSGAP